MKLLEHVQVRDDAVARVEWTVAVDSTINRAHQHAAGARKKGLQTGTNGKIGPLADHSPSPGYCEAGACRTAGAADASPARSSAPWSVRGAATGT